MLLKKAFIICSISITWAASAQTPVTNQRLFDTIPFLPEHYARRVALFEREPVVTGKVIFLGNSITEGGQWKKLLNDESVINRGIGGDITFGVLKRLDEIVKRKPSKLFILIGINDIGKDIPVAVIADNCKKIIQQIRSKSPSTKICLQSILPLNPDVPGFPQHYDKQAYVLLANELLKNVAISMEITFIDLFPLFLDDQRRLDAQYTNDGLHLNARGYDVWAKYLLEKGFYGK